jgi:hypothetical protein
MAVPVSTVPAVTNYLFTAIQEQVYTDPLAESILVRIGMPSGDLPPDVLLLTSVRRTLAPRTFIGGGGQDWEAETYNAVVFISTWAASGDADVTSDVACKLNDRLWQLVGYVETAVRNDPSLGGLVDIAYPSATTTDGPEWQENGGLVAQAEVTVHVEVLN